MIRTIVVLGVVAMIAGLGLIAAVEMTRDSQPITWREQRIRECEQLEVFTRKGCELVYDEIESEMRIAPPHFEIPAPVEREIW
jgi:hypothetical protein